MKLFSDPDLHKLIRSFGYTTNGQTSDLVDAILAAQKTLTPHCDSCGTHEVSLQKTCHNSACEEYARDLTVFQGWKSTTKEPR